MGTSILGFIAPDHRTRVRDIIQGVFESRRPAMYEVPVNDAVGAPQWHEGVVIPIVTDGTVEVVAIATTNILVRREAEAELASLRSLVPLCAWCKRVRTDGGYWTSVEHYIEGLGHSNVTHSLCEKYESGLLGGGVEAS